MATDSGAVLLANSDGQSVTFPRSVNQCAIGSGSARVCGIQIPVNPAQEMRNLLATHQNANEARIPLSSRRFQNMDLKC